jgi:hypothetical protein
MVRTGSDSAEAAPRSVLGRSLHTRVETAALATWLERHWHYGEHVLNAHPYRIDIVEAEVASDEVRAPDWSPTPVRLPEGVTLCGWVRAGEWRFLENGGSGAAVAACFDPGGARITVRPAPFGTVPHWLYAALYLCTSEALRASGLLPLHAAVVARGGEATALTAPSGTGKTTTLIHLLARGWHPLAEDLAWLDPATMSVYGWDRGMRLWPDGLGRLPSAWRAAAWQTDVDGKRFLPWSAVEPARVPAARLTRIVALERDQAHASAIGPMARRDSVRVLWEATGVPLTEPARRAAAKGVESLLLQLDFARLRLGTSPLSELEAIAPPALPAGAG